MLFKALMIRELKILAICLAVVLACMPLTTWAQDDVAVEDQCIVCHTEEDYMPDGYNKEDVHRAAGLTCAACHGGDPTSNDEDVAMSKEAGFIGVPDHKDIPGFCGRCHSDIEYMRRYRPRIATDQESQYLVSYHGKLLQQGDQKVAECASCHTAHAILSASDARSTVYSLNVPGTCKKCHGDPDYMKDYRIPTNQYDQYAKSVHGVALLENQDTGAPACNDCHGNHGAMPPGINSIQQVCGSCHVNNQRYFEASKMGTAFEKESLHGCEECHGNHLIHKTSDQMVGTSDKSVCMDCHDSGDNGGKAASAIYDSLSTLATVYDDAQNATKEVQRIGMDDVEIGFLLQEAHQSLIQARTLVHTFDPEKVGEKTREGKTKAEQALEMAYAQMHEYSVRRWGLGMATLFITVVAIALYFKIRDMRA